MWFGELMVQKLRLIGIAVLSILVFTIVGAIFLSPAFAAVPLNLAISTATPMSGQTFQFTGTDANGGASPWYFTIALNGPNPGCNNPAVSSYNGILLPASSSPFTVSVTADSSFVVGTTYCAYFVDSLSPISLGSNIVTFTIQPATPIPEYPYGLSVLAIFMMLAYGVIRRKTRFDYT